MSHVRALNVLLDLFPINVLPNLLLYVKAINAVHKVRAPNFLLNVLLQMLLNLFPSNILLNGLINVRPLPHVRIIPESGA